MINQKNLNLSSSNFPYGPAAITNLLYFFPDFISVMDVGN